MLPYLVAAGHYKYVSCLPHYLAAMRALPTLAPDVAVVFNNGQFTVRQRVSGQTCNLRKPTTVMPKPSWYYDCHDLLACTDVTVHVPVLLCMYLHIIMIIA